MSGDTPSLAETVLDRIKQIEGIQKDKDLASLLLSDPKNVSAWRNRGIVPWERLVEYSRTKGVSFDWLINGYGPPRRCDFVMEPGGSYKADTSQSLVYQLAADIYRAAAEADVKLSGGKFSQIVRLAHLEALERGAEVPYAKIVELVKLAT